jgi:hypothetical protein
MSGLTGMEKLTISVRFFILTGTLTRLIVFVSQIRSDKLPHFIARIHSKKSLIL